MDPAGTVEPLGNILVAIDFSRGDPLERALQLRICRGSSITLLHVLPPDLPPPLDWSFRRAAERLLDQLVGHAESSLQAAGRHDIAVFRLLAVGKPVAAICEQADDVRAELIVVGRSGLSGSAKHRLGATAERIARAAPASVLVVAGPPRGAYRTPLVAIDGGEPARSIIEMARRIVSVELRTLMLAHAFYAPGVDAIRRLDLPEDDLAEYTERFAGDARARLRALVATLPHAPIGYEPVVLEGDPRRVLVEEAARRNADLIVVGTRGHGALLRLLLGSVAEAVLRDAATDVLVVR